MNHVPGLVMRGKGKGEDPLIDSFGEKGKRGKKYERSEVYKMMTAVFLFLLGMSVLGVMDSSRHGRKDDGITVGKGTEQQLDQGGSGVEPVVVPQQGEPQVLLEERSTVQSRMMNPGSKVAADADRHYYTETRVEADGVVEIVVRTCPTSQPLVQLFPNYFPRNEFESLRSNLYSSSDMTDSSLFEENFGYTTGWMIRFNAEGIEQVKNHPKFKMVMPYFEKARNPDANAFVINYLVCHQPPEDQDAVGYHLDNSVAIMNEIALNYTHAAHQVNVLYLDAPEGMEGGKLEVWPFEMGDTENTKSVVNPAENLMAEFRGDAFHRVGKIKLPDGKSRVGIVFEQYKISPKFYKYLIPFCVGDDCDRIAAGVPLSNSENPEGKRT